jgi:NAD(P)H-hydrate epimerase
MDETTINISDQPMLWFSRHGLMEVDRRAVEQFGINVLALMENAGRQVAEVTRSYLLEGSAVLILAGAGNNGGDGLVAARHLANRGHRIRIILIAEEEKFKGAAKAQLQIARNMQLPIQIFSRQPNSLADFLEHSDVGDAVIDAMFGTGLNRPLDAAVCALIDQLNCAHRRVISVDIPSGLDCDTGEVLGNAVEAAHTVSFCGMKIGFQSADAIRYLGQISIGDIGAPHALLRACAHEGI